MTYPYRRIFTHAAHLGLLIGVMGCTGALVGNGGDEVVQRRTAGKSISFVENKTYQTECTSCHVGYLPGFLPERSWKKLMKDLENHFGEDASLDNPALDEITKYLVVNAAGQQASSARSKKIAAMIPGGETPLRITETEFWKRKHGDVKAYVWKRPKVGSKSRCDVCHRDAGKGIFNEHDVHIPKS